MNAHHDGKNLIHLGAGNFAYFQKGGSWGWSNAGLVTSEGESLLVDTLFDLPNTQAMLDELRTATSAAKRIETIVNTHHDGDHVNGNQLVHGARIISSKAAKDAMAARASTKGIKDLLGSADDLGTLGDFLQENFADFDFSGIELALPTETFVGQTTVTVGAKQVQLVQVGPAHTQGDVLAYVPEDNVVFAGDILFNRSHPVVWAGPPSRWIDACNLILSWDAEYIIPGHGPLATNDDVIAHKNYFETLLEIGAEMRDKGLTSLEAAREVKQRNLWPDLGEWERLVVNLDAVYRQLGAAPTYEKHMDAFAAMANFRSDYSALQEMP